MPATSTEPAARGRLFVAGGGTVGRTLARLLRDAGVDTACVCNRSLRRAADAVAFVGAGKATASLADLDPEPLDLLMVTTADDAIEACAAELAAARANLDDVIAFHCSGALSSAILDPLAQLGARVASVHPIKSFASAEDAVRTFPGTYCAVEGDREAVSVLSRLFEAVGARTFAIDPHDKVLYHAGLALLCNDLYALLHAGFDVFRRAGVSEPIARAALRPILEETLSNAFARGPVDSLTGPAARGDAGVVARHVRAIESAVPQYVDVYRALGDVAAAMALERGSIDAEARARLRGALTPDESR